MDVDFEKTITDYLRLRDAIAIAEDKHKDRMKPHKALLETLGNRLQAWLLETNQDSARTKAGTVYLNRKSSATIADGELFRRFVVENQQFDLVDFRANAPAVAQYIEANRGHLPPGVNFSTVVTVGVRRS